MKINKWQLRKRRFMKKYMVIYNIFIIVAAVSLITLNHTNLGKEKAPRAPASIESKGHVESRKIKPRFFERLPNSFKKVKQSIQIDIDYEKLPDRKMIRLIGTIDSAHIPSDIIKYKWYLTKNLKFKKGKLAGSVNMTETNEITLDAEIIDMEKPINVRLEAYVLVNGVKIGAIQPFLLDLKKEDDESGVRTLSNKLEELDASQMTKEEYLFRQMEITNEMKARGIPKFQQ